MDPLPVGLILAGGQSRRMGGTSKAALDFNGQALIAHVADRLRPQVGILWISANETQEGYASLGAGVLSDPAEFTGAGPLAGILAGLEAAALAGATDLLVVPCDAPFLPTDLGHRLHQARVTTGTGLALARAQGRMHPVFALWSVSLRSALREHLQNGQRKVLDVTAALDAVSVDFPDPEEFMNVNTPQDLTAALKLAAKRPT